MLKFIQNYQSRGNGPSLYWRERRHQNMTCLKGLFTCIFLCLFLMAPLGHAETRPTGKDKKVSPPGEPTVSHHPSGTTILDSRGERINYTREQFQNLAAQVQNPSRVYTGGPGKEIVVAMDTGGVHLYDQVTKNYLKRVASPLDHLGRATDLRRKRGQARKCPLSETLQAGKPSPRFSYEGGMFRLEFYR